MEAKTDPRAVPKTDCPRFGRSWPPRSPKKPQEAPKIPPAKTFQETPGRPQDAPGDPQDAPKTAPRGFPKTDRPRLGRSWPQRDFKKPLRSPRRRPKRPPRRSKQPPGRPLVHRRQSQLPIPRTSNINKYNSDANADARCQRRCGRSLKTCKFLTCL